MRRKQRRRGRRRLWGVLGGGPVGRAGWPVRAALQGRHIRANPHGLASNKECSWSCCCRACWNGTGTASNRASWNVSGRNMRKYAKNLQLYVKNMHKICKYIDCISQICKFAVCTKYARNMLKYAYYMPLYAKYAPNMQICRLYYSNMHEICTKYAKLSTKYAVLWSQKYACICQ